MKNYINKWITCKHLYYKDEFQEINNLVLVHPDYWDFVKKNGTQTIYKCIGADKDFLIIRSKKFDLKVKKEAIQNILPSPVYEWGMLVKEINREVTGVIDDLFWHQNKQDFLYYISVANKRKSRQYSAPELTLLAEDLPTPVLKKGISWFVRN